MNRRTLMAFARYARRVSKRPDEAEDLLQTVLLAAVEAGRLDLTSVDNRRWVMGALRRRAAFDARSALRRRRRDVHGVRECDAPVATEQLPTAFVETLPPSLKTTAWLALTGHTRAEAICLLGISNSAFRQRIAEIRRRWRRAGGSALTDFHGLHAALPYGRVRRALLTPVKRGGGRFASHDPDGHLFVVCSQNPAPRQQV